MTRTLLLLSTIVSVALALPSPVSNVFEIDISPEEAQRYLASLPFTKPQLSGRTATLPLVRWNDARFRSAEAGPTLGHYWKNGHEIENTDDYVEEVYDASQFHGQDGLGAYAYGYAAPESSKVENRQQSGDVTGSYTYRDGNNELIKVRYWADSEGFHQEDNVPRVQPEPAQETPEVREARLAHEKAWNEAAAAAAANPDPQGEYSSKYESHGEHSAAASELQPSVAEREGRQYQAQSSASYSQQPKTYQQSYSQQSAFSQSGGASKQSASASAYSQGGKQHPNKIEEAEPTGPPRGFFYSYTYPVSIIVAKNAGGPQGPLHPGSPLDHDTVGVSAHH